MQGVFQISPLGPPESPAQDHHTPQLSCPLIVFRQGARVKNRATPLIDNNKHTHLFDEQQV
jgi:hypothetical protein